jgi:hypothetical protein
VVKTRSCFQLLHEAHNLRLETEDLLLDVYTITRMLVAVSSAFSTESELTCVNLAYNLLMRLITLVLLIFANPEM